MSIRNEYAVIVIIAIFGICSYLSFEVVRMNRLINAGAIMSRNAVKYERPIEGKNEILILGDSLAYGVGVSKPADSFAGVIAEHFKNKSVKNNAVIGETINSLQTTLDIKLTTHYERVYIIVGGNDIMRMHINVFNSDDALRTLVEETTRRADKVYLVTTGDFKKVSLSPWLLRDVFSLRANMIRNTALDLESKFSNFDYVDFKSNNIKSDEYKKLEAADGYHLNDEGIQQLVSIMLSEVY